MRALVIDESRTVRIIIGSILQEIGLEVLEAANGVDALDQLQRNQDLERTVNMGTSGHDQHPGTNQKPENHS